MPKAGQQFYAQVCTLKTLCWFVKYCISDEECCCWVLYQKITQEVVHWWCMIDWQELHSHFWWVRCTPAMCAISVKKNLSAHTTHSCISMLLVIMSHRNLASSGTEVKVTLLQGCNIRRESVQIYGKAGPPDFSCTIQRSALTGRVIDTSRDLWKIMLLQEKSLGSRRGQWKHALEWKRLMCMPPPPPPHPPQKVK